jgi:catalase
MAKKTANNKPSRTTADSAPPRMENPALEGDFLTTNQGLRISDNHNTLTAGPRGPALLEDFVLREKITSFDHERIPERVVHARGAGAFGVFECTKDMSKFTQAGFLGKVGKKTPMLVRFSTVAGSRGSADTARDVRGFAAKFYTDEGNYDLVGNNMPVFFIQDAMKFPDLIHSVKPEQHNEIPQASSAHDTFWDFISLMPESTHMIFWAMSDRAIPRSYRMMEGFGVHTFRFVNDKGVGTFVKFHWKPKLGMHSLVWEEAQLLAGLDPDFHRRDLFEAIDSGAFPVWELGVQMIPEADEHKYDFDLLDPTKLVPEELVPVTFIGRMTLDRNPDNYFAEIEQAVFHPGHLPPGIDVSNDPLLAGRLFSYTDTQITRLGGPNFHELPVNRPLAAVNNHQRDGFGRQTVPKGRVAYEPNSVGGGCPMHSPEKMKSYVSYTQRVDGHTVRARSESFGDHFSQAKLFFNSQTKPEQDHIRKAFTFELSKLTAAPVRERMLSTLMLVDEKLAAAVADGLGVKLPKKGVEQPSPANPSNNIVPPNRSQAQAIEDAEAPGKRTMSPSISPALSMLLNLKKSVETRQVAVLATSLNAEVKALKTAIEAAGAVMHLVSPKLEASLGEASKSLKSTPSVAYDGVIALAGKKDYNDPEDLGHALKFVAQAFKHCKTVGATDAGHQVVHAATMGLDDGAPGMVRGKGLAKEFLAELGKHRHWERADLVKALPA